MSRANEHSTHITLATPSLDGYGGRLEIISARRQPWYRRWLRRPQRYRRDMVYANIAGGHAKAWRYRRSDATP